MDQDKYTLHWRTYSDHLRDILKELSSDDSFADVTLVTDDKKQIKVHRNILSACSPVFKEILTINNNNNHPVIYLRGIQYPEIESILQFIYLGEAKFYKKRMNEFLTVAKNLDIRELSKGIIEEGDSAEVNKDDTNIKTEEFPIQADNVVEPSHLDIDEAPDVQQKTHNNAVNKHECQQCDKAYTRSCLLTRHIQSVHDGVRYACNQCDYQAAYQGDLTKHIQSKHEGVKYDCNKCDYQGTSQSSLTVHIRFKHEGVKFACDQCDHQFTTPSNLTKHIKRRVCNSN